jgi:hypothetical protein
MITSSSREENEKKPSASTLPASPVTYQAPSSV